MNKKKKIIVSVTTAIAVLTIAGISGFAYAQSNAQKNSIGLDKALNIAMTDAGVSDENTRITKAQMEFEKGTFAYDIEFVSGVSNEYDYVIKASDGTILDRDFEIDDDIEQTSAVTTQQDIQTSVTESTTQNTILTTEKAEVNHSETTTVKAQSKDITLAKAKDIALKDAGVSESSAKFTSAKKDYDDGVNYYDIEFRTSDYEYEYEISMNGKILSFDKDKIVTKKVTTSAKAKKPANYIGVDKAKQIALNNAGLTSSKVTFTKAKLEKDDGIYQYEIEFKTSAKEYEYDINATTGKIISHSTEPLDDDYDD